MPLGVRLRLLLLLLMAEISVQGVIDNAMFGEIASPGYPDPYPNDTRNEWRLKVPEGYRVQLQFSYFDIEPSQRCIYDSLEVFSERKSLGKFCGNGNNVMGNYPGHQLLISKKNSMKLDFKSDFSNEDRYLGFLAHYEAIDVDECSQQDEEDLLCDQLCHNTLGSYICSCHHGYQLQADGKSCEAQCQEFFDHVSGHVSSLEYPRPYPPNLRCNYSLMVERGYSIHLEFQELFEIDAHDEVPCPYDQLLVAYRNNLDGPLCGNVKPNPIDTQSNIVNILFNTDDSGDSRGWKLYYTTDRIRCPDLNTLDHGTIQQQQDHYRFLDHVSFTCDVGYKIMEGDKELKSFGMLCTGDGVWNKEVIPTCQIIDCGVPEKLENGRFRTLKETSMRNGYLSEIKYTCDKRYMMATPGSGQYTCSMTRDWVNNAMGKVIPYCAPVCGKPDHSVTSGRGRIYGGALAPQGSFPWQVYLRSPRGGRAGGILVSDQWVMTAAHVIHPKDTDRPSEEEMKTFQVFMGNNSLNQFKNSGSVPVERVYVHEEYSGDTHQYFNDLALIKLGRKVRLTQDVVPICLPPAHSPALYRNSLLGYVAGWGVTQDHRLLNELHYVGLPIADQDTCARTMKRAQVGSDKPELLLTPGMFCAGTGLGVTDSCQGDSGGAYAMHQRGDDTWYATGIVSWGLDCGQNGTYGVYTRVSGYRDWIDRVMATG
ncbi:complement C1r-A subcomponent-like [Scyliorhinus canicula]|uniref:complement C1r-A subcomponent-like n=1 Tax=Scyliorhinus canicula TaxID=7830 RepID=UPI0018F57EF4|nr:complement C1r-A subcomponent-like [Scyliorhinus canicula]